MPLHTVSTLINLLDGVNPEATELLRDKHITASAPFLPMAIGGERLGRGGEAAAGVLSRHTVTFIDFQALTKDQSVTFAVTSRQQPRNISRSSTCWTASIPRRRNF
jgi:hypothetical protein